MRTSKSKQASHFVQWNASQQCWIRHRAMVVLSPAEQRVLQALARGVNAPGAGRMINRSPKTIGTHAARLMHRMGIPNRRALAIAAEQLYGADEHIPDLDISALSDRELEILDLASQGLTYEQVGERAGISADSVWARITSVKKKVGVERLEVLLASARKAFAA